ncbi:SusC/RagA family TonB-linked outer membrane protein [Marinoscillum furvescens]|uniref:TonB-linked SusC/RagA family outer membrane protein n=1 Tax=Marinoscillum furvescens DSM 4134 TaxID=1122208 RepID=A0A3D9L8C4_MARFU|nr:SusC/RagA family TonB-linked outer membrane protein [Marinoscillum furvescens]REE02090.1 TonB-linked SusC/RagA family outer membrane protein [Marinoscillum furvescens DSM 4134]
MRKLLLLACTLMLSGILYAQERTVSGKVVGDDGEALPGVNVVIKGSTQGTITDLDGNYRLAVPADIDPVIVFSFIGMQAKEVELGQRSVLDVTLEQDVQQLTEVVVTAFGVERDKKALGYAVQEFNSDELTKSQERSVINSLQGKVAGVQITGASGAPGASTNIVLRGTSSLTGSNQALFVVDGVPINNVQNNSGGVLTGAVDGGNSANDINPEDIKSISILKGASAAALYGSRAANGVVIITTKKGANTGGQVSVDYNTSLTYERVLMLPELQNEFGQGQQGDNLGFLNDQESWGDRFDGSERPYGIAIGDPSSPFFNTQRTKIYEALPDNIREFWKIGRTWQNSVALSGGSENASFRLSLSDLSQSGVVPNAELRRNTVALSGSTKVNDKLDFTGSVNYIKQNSDLAINGQGGESPYNQVLQTSRSMSIIEQRDLSNPYNSVDWFYTPFIQNPYYNLFNDSYVKNMDRIYGSFAINYKPVENLTLTTRVGSDVISDDRKRVKERRIASAISPNGSADEPGFIRDEAYTDRQLDANFIASYNYDINQDFNVNALVGYNFNQRDGRDFTASVDQTSIPDFNNISNGAVNPTVTETSYKRRLMGVYGQLDVSFRNFVFLGATYRNDWSSTLPLENNSFGYPGVNTSIVLTDAFDFGISDILSFWKIRASYAEVGNDAPTYLTSSVFFAPQGTTNAIQGNFGRVDFPINGVPGFTEGNRIGNPGLKPELSKEYEVGTDLRLFNGRINLDMAYFHKTSQDQIVIAQAAPSSGFSSQVINAGTIENKGWEVLLATTPIKINDFSWGLSVNYTKINNMITDLPSGEITIGTGLLNYQLKAIEGQPYGVFEAPTALRTDDGRLIVDGNGLPQQAPDPARFGTVQPDWLGGITTTLRYKSLTFSATIDHRQGGKVYSRTIGQIYFNGTAVETGFNNRERFIIPFSVVDDGEGNFVPNTSVLTYSSNNIRQYWNQINNYGEYLIIDGTFTKLREMTLSYRLPKALLAQVPFKEVNVSVFGRNLWIHTPDDNTYIDPEVNSFTGGNQNVGNLTGFEFGTVPSTSTYGIRLRITL